MPNQVFCFGDLYLIVRLDKEIWIDFALWEIGTGRQQVEGERCLYIYVGL